MKARLMQFYRDQIHPRLAALKAKAVHLKQRAGAWLNRHQRRLRQVAVVTTALAVVVAGAILWHRWPALRTAGKGLAAAVTGLLTGLWALLRSRRPAEIPVPVVATAEPAPVEAPFPVEAGPADAAL